MRPSSQSDVATCSSTQESSAIAVDEDLMNVVADTGRWQLLVTLLLAFTLLLIVANRHATLLFAPPHVQYWCAAWPPDLGFEKWPPARWINLSRPRHVDEGQSESCFMFDVNYTQYAGLGDKDPLPDLSGKPIKQCDRFLFSPEYGRTVTEQWSAVCKNRRFEVVSEAVFHAGLMVGNIVVGLLSDKLGRKSTMLFCLGLQPFLGITVATATTMFMFLATRCLLGVTVGGVAITALVIVMEIVGNEYRTLACGLFLTASGLGLVALSALSAFFHNWKKLQLAITIPSALFFVFVGFVPESPLWLLNVLQVHRAESILSKAANFNGRELSVSIRLSKKSPTVNAADTVPERSALWIMLQQTRLSRRAMLLAGLWVGALFCHSFLLLALCALPDHPGSTVLLAGQCRHHHVVSITLVSGADPGARPGARPHVQLRAPLHGDERRALLHPHHGERLLRVRHRPVLPGAPAARSALSGHVLLLRAPRRAVQLLGPGFTHHSALLGARRRAHVRQPGQHDGFRRRRAQHDPRQAGAVLYSTGRRGAECLELRAGQHQQAGAARHHRGRGELPERAGPRAVDPGPGSLLPAVLPASLEAGRHRAQAAARHGHREHRLASAALCRSVLPERRAGPRRLSIEVLLTIEKTHLCYNITTSTINTDIGTYKDSRHKIIQ